MHKLLCSIPALITFALVVAWLGCDEYNIVEPRFYTEDDVVTFAACEHDPFAEPAGAIVEPTTIVQAKTIPAIFAVGGCWFDRSAGVLAVAIALPVAGQAKVSILNSAGGVEAVLFEGPHEAGFDAYPWVASEDGVYAISLQVDKGTAVLWFEVD